MKKRRVIGLIVVGVVLGIGAVVLAQTFSVPVIAQSAGPTAPEREIVISVHEVVNGESFGGEVRLTYADAAELPDAAADDGGLFVSRSGNDVILGTGLIEVLVDVEVVNDEEPVRSINASYDGDEIQVQVTAATLIYEDITERPEISPADIEAGEMTIQQVVQPGSIEDLGENTEIRVWGTTQNGVLVADILVYEPIR